MGDSIVLTTACSGAPREGTDFFPLQVDYREKYAAAGKFPGGYIKREGRPSTKEILICRMIDRLTTENGGLPQESLTKMIDTYTADYVETLGGARRRLNRALEIILTSYYANTLKLRADALVHGLRDR